MKYAHHSIRLLLIAAMLMTLGVVAAPASAGAVLQSSGASQDAAALPAGVPGDWWATVQGDSARSEYEITWQEQTALAELEASYQAPNRAQNLRTYFTPEGIRVIPRIFEGEAPPWEWGLALAGYGAGQAVERAALASNGNRIEYRRGAVTEWYVNDERGLEQGFTLAAPADPASDQVVLTLAWHGDLEPGLSEDGQAIDWTTAGGARVLRYDSLVATDAAGRELPARMEVDRAGRAIRLLVDGSGARYPVTIDPLTTSPTWMAEGNQDGASFGQSVGTAGDVNGDGYADVIVGAPYYDNGQGDEGMAFVYLGGAAGLSAAAAWTAKSDQAGAVFGTSVGTAGDVNGDGYADVIVGAYFHTNGQTNEGGAWVYLGSAAGLGATAAWAAECDQAGASFGGSVGTAGDVNGDGYADVIVGARFYDNGQDGEGAAFVYPGSAAGLATAAAWTLEIDQDGAYFGTSVGTAGDVNGDGYDDVIVGAPTYDNGQGDEGGAWVYLGSAAGLSATAAWMAEGNQAPAWFGGSVGTAGDVNGDGYADVIVGARWYSNGQANEGAAFVYLGSAAGLGAAAGWTAEGNQDAAYFGTSVGTAGDVNGDGYGDVIVGASSYDSGQGNEGAAFVYQGGASGLAAAAAWTAESDQDGAYFGTSVGTAGDVNGDGHADVIVGARNYDNGQGDEGAAFVYLGSASGPGAAAAWTAEGNQANAQFGYSARTAGDVNGDGYGDVIVGAPTYDNGQTNEGAVFVYLGSASGLGAAAAWTAEGNQAHAYFGTSVGTAGDVNGDGYADVIVGAPAYGSGQIYGGAAFVYLGSAAGLGAMAAWTAAGNQGGAQFGGSVGTAGDVNGDGYGDVIVGAPTYDNGQGDEGAAWVFQGSAAGLGATTAWTAEGDQVHAYFGTSVAAAGDVNGDGYGDVIVGAPNYANGQDEEGAAFVYLGSAAGLHATAAWTAESDQDSAEFGASVGTGGDVNGDGYGDVIVGAPAYDSGQTDEGGAWVYLGNASGLGVAAARTNEGNQDGARFGSSVGTAGDVNGDGYADVIVGARTYDNGQTDEGAAWVYLGNPTGLGATAAWTAEGDQANAEFGNSVGTAGDVNGDNYSDVIVGVLRYDNGQTDEGRAFMYFGNGGPGLAVRPQQRRADDTAAAGPGGQVVSPDEARLAALLRTPFGRSDVALQWEVKPEGTAFDGSGLGQSAWMDSGVAGASLSQLVSGLAFEARYHWRVRILGRPLGAAANSVATYRSRWLYGSTFMTALSGPQAIGGTGQTTLLGQAPYVDVANLGSPALTSLDLRGYPSTLPPNASSFSGYGGGTAVLGRYFSLEPNGGAAGYSLTLCLNYDDSEVTAAGADEPALQLCRWTGSAWACQPRAAASSMVANLVCAANVTAFSNWAIASGEPMAVTIAGFSAEPANGQVLVTWETASELDNAGFNLYRGLQADGGDRVMLAFVPSQAPGSTQGFSYSYADTTVEPGRTYWYWLEDVDLAGVATLHGPVSATVAAPAAVKLSRLEAFPMQAKVPMAAFPALAAAAVTAIWARRKRR